jgi:TetR/AcrR family transcriptional regulator
LLHYYFRSKEKLFEVIFQEVAAELLPRINQVLEADLPLYEKIEKFCSTYIDKIMQNPYLPLFFIDEANKQPDLFLHKIFGQQPPQTGVFLNQVAEEVKRGLIKPIHPAQLFLNMTSLCLFPFLSKPIWQFISGMDEVAFRQFMEQRKTEVPQFIINAIRK